MRQKSRSSPYCAIQGAKTNVRQAVGVIGALTQKGEEEAEILHTFLFISRSAEGVGFGPSVSWLDEATDASGVPHWLPVWRQNDPD
jgi:hypothetical protein